MCHHCWIIPHPFNDFPCYFVVHSVRQTSRSHQYVPTPNGHFAARRCTSPKGHHFWPQFEIIQGVIFGLTIYFNCKNYNLNTIKINIYSWFQNCFHYCCSFIFQLVFILKPKIDGHFRRRFAAIYGLAIYFKLRSSNLNTMIIIILSWFYNCFTLSATLLGAQAQERQPFWRRIEVIQGLTILFCLHKL